MGIPSYYKKLIDAIPGLITKQHPVEDIQWLFMDFNCLIYHCLHHAPPYTPDTKESWEQLFIECVQTYCLKVIKQVSPKSGVFIAIDGVVPMAKMRQQRLRRFKSAWLSCTSKDAGSKWDTNAITPGTTFMDSLKKGLESMIKKHGKASWHLSSSDEPGEGEHKIIAQWRLNTYKGNFAVYGLDADLIVLSMLGHESCGLTNKIWLFREEVTAGVMTYDEAGEEVFEWFSILMLRDWLNVSAVDKRQFLLNYCFAMSVLGNDFLPGSLGLKIREDGHTELLTLLSDLTIPLIDSVTLAVSQEGVKALFVALSKTEEERICKYVSKKQMFSRNLGAEVPAIGDNNWPLYNVEEEFLLESKKQLVPQWKALYLTRFFPGYTFDKETIHDLCKEYLFGIQWIWAYYTGGDICYNWHFPHSLPPLWEWLSAIHTLPSFPDRILIRAHDIRPVEQLSIVLPLESWSLIPPCSEKQLPYLAPHFFPSAFSFESVGKRFFWECESLIPLPSIMELKSIIT